MAIFRTVLIGAFACLAPLGPVMAGEGAPAGTPWSAGLMISTLGPGLQVSYHAYEWFAVRAEGTYVSIPVDGLTGSLRSAGAIVDVHPFRNAFRLSGGVRYFEYNISGTTVMKDGDTSNTYHVAITNTNKADPYLGLGFDSSHFYGDRYDFRVGLDIGAVYSGMPSVSVANLDHPEDDVQSEIKNFISKYQYMNFYPVVTLSARLTF
jgi:hypothetical protein